MRQIGSVDRSELAEHFQNVLIAQGTKCSIEAEGDQYAIWVHDDDKVLSSRQQFEAFLRNPEAPEYRAAYEQATSVLKDEAAQRKVARRNIVRMSDRWSSGSPAMTPVTISVMVACLFVFIQTDMLNDKQNLSTRLFFSTDGTWGAIADDHQYWRIFTPALMHGSLLHILFNLLWWWDLGRAIEWRKGSGTLLFLTIVIAGSSNSLQFAMGNPWFLGLSGVVFGLFGYVWVKGKLDPEDGLGISNDNAIWMMVWFVICWFGWVGQIANWAHTGGLIAGMLLGLCSVAWRQARRRL